MDLLTLHRLHEGLRNAIQILKKCIPFVKKAISGSQCSDLQCSKMYLEISSNRVHISLMTIFVATRMNKVMEK